MNTDYTKKLYRSVNDGRTLNMVVNRINNRIPTDLVNKLIEIYGEFDKIEKRSFGFQINGKNVGKSELAEILANLGYKDIVEIQQAKKGE